MIYGISGKKRSGKNTIALIWRLLCFYTKQNNSSDKAVEWVRGLLSTTPPEEMNFECEWIEKSFAHKLKQIVAILFDFEVTDFEREDFKNGRVSGFYGIDSTNRGLLQRIGTELFREHLHQDIWITTLLASCKESSKWLITDVRFPNEADAIKECGGKVIRVIRGSNTLDSHASETALDNYANFDYEIENNGDVFSLIQKVKDIMVQEGVIDGDDRK